MPLRVGKNPPTTGIGAVSFNLGTSGGWKEALQATGSMSTGTWYHIVGTYDGTNVITYINGAQQASTGATATISSSTYNVNFGGCAYSRINEGASGGRYYNGKIDEVRISNVARSQCYIQTEYDNTNWPNKAQDGANGFVTVSNELETGLDVSLGEHSGGQERDKFMSASSVTGAELFAFRLTNNTGSTMTVDQVQFQLSSVTGVAQGDFANLAIYVDSNSDGAIGGGETTTVGGTGVVDAGVSTITFGTDFAISAGTTANYILKGDVNNLVAGDTVTIGLGTFNVTLTSGTVGGTAPTNVTHTTDAMATGYSYRKAITIGGQIGGSCGANLANFPVLINITGDTNLKTVANGGHVQNANGYDIIFRDENGNQLDHEVESYDGAAGTLVAWVRVPTLSYNVDTPVFMYYGKSDVTSPTENPAGVWGSNYKGVWHVHDDLEDSTSNNNDATNNGTSSGTGKIANARSYNGASYLEVANSASLNVTSELTMEAWLKPNACANSKVVGKTDSGHTRGYLLAIGNDCTVYPEIWDSTGYDHTFNGIGTALTPSQWGHLAVTWKTGGNMVAYVNGSQVNSISAGTYDIGTSTNVLRMGTTPWGNPPHAILRKRQHR
jgi:hypothetical protein